MFRRIATESLVFCCLEHGSQATHCRDVPLNNKNSPRRAAVEDRDSMGTRASTGTSLTCRMTVAAVIIYSSSITTIGGPSIKVDKKYLLCLLDGGLQRVVKQAKQVFNENEQQNNKNVDPQTASHFHPGSFSLSLLLLRFFNFLKILVMFFKKGRKAKQRCD